MPPFDLQQLFNLALEHHRYGRLKEAEQLYRQILIQDSSNSEALHNLGVLSHQMGHNEMAIALIERVVAQKPTFAQAYSNLGNALGAIGQIDRAIAMYRRAIAIDASLAGAHTNLGNALLQQGLHDEAANAFQTSLSLRPADAKTNNCLGIALIGKGKTREAIAAFRKALSLNPDFPEALNNLGNALRADARPEEALTAFNRAISLFPGFFQARCNLGCALQDVGQLEEAIQSMEAALAIESNATVRSNLIFAMQNHSRSSAADIGLRCREWDKFHAQPLRESICKHTNDPDPGRPLRIGYVSADFCDHASAHFLMPLFRSHDRQHTSIYCYAEVSAPDPISRRIQHLVDGWRSTVGRSDEQVAHQIRDDRIDILVDLKLHTAENRLLIFARKPAPVQVTWLGYPGTTGLSAIDYRISDPYLDPPGPALSLPNGMDESIYSEKTVRLPDTFWCYDPLDGRDVFVSPPPVIARGFITFGCLNNFCKVNPEILALWAKVMREVRGSRLLLLSPLGRHRQRALDQFTELGIDSDRIEFADRLMRREYLALYHRIDIGLDSFPYNGHTTSLDSLWMGVPVITLVGQRAVARAGWCQLSNLGLTELAANEPEQFVHVAVQLAGDLPRLAHLRVTLRRRMEQSPLMDASKFAKNIEAAYRQMWKKWCKEFSKGQPPT